MQRLGFALTATMKRKKTNEERTFSEASQQTDDRMTLAAVLLVLSQRELHTCESKPHVKPASLYCRLTRVRFFPSCFVAAVSKQERLLQALQPQTEKRPKKIGMMQFGRTGSQPAHHHSGSSATNQRCQVPWSCPLAAVVPGALWGSAYNMQGGCLKAPGQESTAASWLLERWKRWSKFAKGPRVELLAKRLPYCRPSPETSKWRPARARLDPLLLGHRKRRWARR